MVNRIILWLSLAGMILALHLWIQKARGFDQGCLGLDKHAAPVAGGCTQVSDLPASHLLGVSNAAWGYAFYFGLATLSFGKILSRAAWARRLHLAGEVLMVGAFAYSVYLVYMMAVVAKAYCVLCLTSAALVTVLAALHGWIRWRGGFQPIAEAERGAEVAIAVGGLFAAGGVLVGVVIFVNRLGTRPLGDGNSGRQLEQLVGAALPLYIDGAKLAEMRPCRVDESAPALSVPDLVKAELPFLGPATGVSVMTFYDPNCGFCKNHFPDFLKLVEQYKDRVRFQIVPRRLWDYSSRQEQALLLAGPTGKSVELWKAMFARQKPGGLSTEEVTEVWREVGLDATNLETRLAAMKPVLEDIQRKVDRAVRSVPAVFVDGKPVWTQSTTNGCIGTLVGRVEKARGEQTTGDAQKAEARR